MGDLFASIIRTFEFRFKIEAQKSGDEIESGDEAYVKHIIEYAIADGINDYLEDDLYNYNLLENRQVFNLIKFLEKRMFVVFDRGVGRWSYLLNMLDDVLRLNRTLVGALKLVNASKVAGLNDDEEYARDGIGGEEVEFDKRLE
jgi:hypothetical protein